MLKTDTESFQTMHNTYSSESNSFEKGKEILDKSQSFVLGKGTIKNKTQSKLG